MGHLNFVTSLCLLVWTVGSVMGTISLSLPYSWQTGSKCDLEQAFKSYQRGSRVFLAIALIDLLGCLAQVTS